ncbi:unnamed protein product [Onchocerca flexuosa]|uniref:PAM2 domain-containing protein n=1 Tax=Onchocerca flexuosa TaxID=387005 RepID=A0A183I2A6_9BILA|nr:unnamed protein product [Onchocerca flexuosa]
MSEKEPSESGILSAPIEENSSSNIIDHTTASYQQPPPVQPDLLLGPQSPVRSDMGLPPYREPPPSYQAAMAYPAASGPYSTNSNNTTFPKPYTAVPPYPLLSLRNQLFPPTTPPLLRLF